jgi:Ni,Fe-hydrogenase maturation factor
MEAVLIVDACLSDVPPGRLALAKSHPASPSQRAAAVHFLSHQEALRTASVLRGGISSVCWLLIGIAAPPAWGQVLSLPAQRGARLAARWIRWKLFRG